MQTDDPWLLNAVPSRLDEGPEGLGGGKPGRGRALSGERQAGERRPRSSRSTPDDVVLLETPGGGGYGPPAKG